LRLNFILVIVIPRILFSQIIDVSCSVFKDRNFYFVRRSFVRCLYIIPLLKIIVNDFLLFFSIFLPFLF